MRKNILTTFILLSAFAGMALANTAPTGQVISAAMRPGTTLMDVAYRVTDPDDATVQVRALAFVDGIRSFSNVLRVATLVEGTATNIGDAIAAGVDHTLTWAVGADWDIDLGQVKFEILYRDGRGLLEFDWITIPAAGGHDEMTISKNAPADAAVLDALFWQYADGDTGLTLTNGISIGSAESGIFNGVELVKGASVQSYATPYIFKRMNIQPAGAGNVSYAVNIARAGLMGGWHALKQAYEGTSIVWAWGRSRIVPAGLSDVTAIAAGNWGKLALSDGTVVGWGINHSEYNVPIGLINVKAIAAGDNHGLALKNDGTVVAWGATNYGQSTVPVGLSNVTAVAGGGKHSLALKNDGTVAAWGATNRGQSTVPTGLSNVTAIAAGYESSLALKSDGTVVAWGSGSVLDGVSNVTAIAAGSSHGLALKSDGTVVSTFCPPCGTIPEGLSNVTAIAAGFEHNLALKSDGTVVSWGISGGTVPAGLSNVTAIAAGFEESLALIDKQP